MQHFDAARTRAGLPFGPLIDALRQAFGASCEGPLRHTHNIAGADGQPLGTVLLMPAWRPGGRLGIKTVNVFPGNAALGKPGLHAVYTLFDAGSSPASAVSTAWPKRRRTWASKASLLRNQASRRLHGGAPNQKSSTSAGTTFTSRPP